MSQPEAVQQRDQVLAEVEAAHRAAIDEGLKVLARWAAKGRPFSANQCRAELRAVGVKSASTGALFNAAIAGKVIRSIGWVTSTDPGTHAKPVNRYIAANQRTPLEALTVPVVRDNGGRFTTQAPDQEPLFEVTA